MKKGIFESGDEGKKSENNDNITNIRKRRIIRRYKPNGTYQDYVVSDSVSLPDEQGNWEDFDLACDYLDDQGNPLPSDLKGVAMSHAGRLVPPDRIAVCGSTFHPPGLTRNIYIDVDGSVTEQGAICSTCMRRRTVFNIVVIAVGGSLLIGLMKGLGWF